MVTRNRTLLGATQLVNDGDTTNLVESVITFEYDRELYWGTLEGVSRGIPTDVYETGKPVMQISWGLRKTAAKPDVSRGDETGTRGEVLALLMFCCRRA